MAIAATAVWRVRISGNNLNGGGYDASIASPGTDYSQQNGAHVTFNGSSVTATGTTATLTLSGYTVATTDVANCLQIASGTNFTAGFYFIISVNVGSNTWTLDRSPVSSGTASAMVGRMGGGWADFWTNTTANIVPGNIIYILGSGTPNPALYTFDYALNLQWLSVAGNQTAGLVTFANDPATPGYKAPPDTTGGMPCISLGASAIIQPGTQTGFQGLYLAYIATSSNFGAVLSATGNAFFGCVYDQAGFDNGFSYSGGVVHGLLMGCEFFSSVVFSGVQPMLPSGDDRIIGCNVHDTCGPGVGQSQFSYIGETIVAKCNGYGIKASSVSFVIIKNCTIDANIGNGIEFVAQADVNTVFCFNNIISNHTTGGTFGMKADAGTAAANNLVKTLIDYNSFYNNTTNYSGISAGAHDTALGSNPFVGQATENYTLA